MPGEDLIWAMFMATVTGIFHIRFLMAGLARNRALSAMIEGKCMPAQGCRRPGGFRVTILTLQSKNPSMDFRFCVALITFLRGACKEMIGMTTGAFRLLMFALEGKESGMIKVAHPVYAIVAIQANRAELGSMLLDEIRQFRSLIRV